MKIRLSVVIPCYNHGKYLPEALESVDKSSNRDEIEVIIVNDGSNDEYTNQYISNLDQNKYVIINQENLGLAKARNNGIRIAKGDYILSLDSDNIVLTPYLIDALEILDTNESISVVYGNKEHFGEKNEIIMVGEYNLQVLMLGNYIDACAVFRKKCWEDVGGYDEKMPYMGIEDWDFWLNLSFSGKNFYYLNCICYKYRFLLTSMMNSTEDFKLRELFLYIQNKYKSYLNYNFIVSRVLNRESTNYELLSEYFNLKIIFKLLLCKVFKFFFYK